VLLIAIGCAPAKPSVGISASRGDKFNDGNDIGMKLIAKDNSSIVLIMAGNGEIKEIPLDSLLKYYYIYKKNNDHGNNK